MVDPRACCYCDEDHRIEPLCEMAMERGLRLSANPDKIVPFDGFRMPDGKRPVGPVTTMLSPRVAATVMPNEAGTKRRYGDGDAETQVVRRDREKGREAMRRYRARLKARKAAEYHARKGGPDA